MKIKVVKKSYDEVMALPPQKHRNPHKQGYFFRLLLKLVSVPDLMSAHFHLEKEGMERLGRREPCFILMNHSSFIDLEIAASALFPRRFSIVCTYDGFVGKNWLMRQLGCIPTHKFIFDLSLVRDISYAVEKNKSSVLMFPEAGYSFDGTATTLPDNLGAFVKRLGIPLVTITTDGAFARQPLYNNLRKRRVRVSAKMKYCLSADELAEMPVEEIDALIKKTFAFDSFAHQQEQHLAITEADRAEGLERILYKCPACLAEGQTEGKGTCLTCRACGKSYTLDEFGYMRADTGETELPHIPDWYAWQREQVRRELAEGAYRLDTPVDIYMLVDTKCLYSVGEGRLVHTAEGFHLTGCDGRLDYRQKPISSYSLNSDFYWYELGDVISIGNQNALYYCIPKQASGAAAKTRLAAEELYKIVRAAREAERAARDAAKAP